MADWKVIDGSLGPNTEITETWSTTEADGSTISPQVRPGTIVSALDMDTSTDYGVGEFIYLKGVASTAAGMAVTYQYGDWQTALIVPNAIGLVGIAMSANLANQWGWYQIRGVAVCEVEASFADDTQVYIGASTDGHLDDGVVAGDVVYTAYGYSDIATPAAGQALISMQYPYVTNL